VLPLLLLLKSIINVMLPLLMSAQAIVHRLLSLLMVSEIQRHSRIIINRSPEVLSGGGMYSSAGGAWNGYGPPVVWSVFPRTENDARPL